MTAPNVGGVSLVLDRAERFVQCRPQGCIEGDVERVVAVFQAAAAHRSAQVFFHQQAVGGELQALAVIGLWSVRAYSRCAAGRAARRALPGCSRGGR